MSRLSGTKRALALTIAALLALVGAIVVTPRATAASAPAPDLRARAIYFQKTGNTYQRALVLSTMANESAWTSDLWAGFLASWDTANNGVKVHTTPPEGLPGRGHVFIVLGSALSRSGGMTVRLERRLRVTLSALAKYPKSKVLVSGGAPRRGRTEAQVMRAWLVAKGINPARILVEAKSASTVGNATNSMAMLNESTEHSSYTLISDASHIRRASILFNAAAVRIQEKTGKTWALTPIANVAYPDSSTASRGRVPVATAAIIASNVASVFGKLTQYRALVASPPPAAKLTSITVTPPTNLTYRVGERLETEGLLVQALFNGGVYSKAVTGNAAITGFSSRKVGRVVVTIAHAEGGVSKTATFPCEILKAASQVSLSLSTELIKQSRTRVVLAAAVTTGASGVVPTGIMRFYLDGQRLKTLTLEADRNGVATLRYPAISAAGRHRITVKYSGDSQLDAVSRTRTVTVKP